MKTVVRELDSDKIKASDLPLSPILGIVADGKKYIPSFRMNGGIATDCIMVRNGYCWDSGETPRNLMNDLLKDDRVKVLYFESLEELAKWILE